MPSYSSIWIPALAVAHLVGLALFLHAIQQINGALTYWGWWLKWVLIYKKKFKGDFKMAWYYTYPGAKEAFDATNAQQTPGGKVGDLEMAKGDMVFLEYMPEPAELSWKDLSYRVKAGTPPQPKTVIQKSSGTFKPGDSVALMGPSGAGKSSLLDLLAGRKIGKGVSGSVTINGKQVTTETASQYTSYVAQEDVFVPTQSVWEALLFYTQLSLPGDLSMTQRQERMNSVLRTMGLEKVKNSKVGGVLPGGLAVRGLSGGEKRRLSIACGLVANPSILFLDEPTTGLDSHAALAVMKHLISLTDLGLTIVASIHQPRQEIFEAFDHVLVLSEGYQMFLAPPSYALHWFRNVMEFPYNMNIDGTVADWLITVVSVNFMKGKNSKSSLGSVEEVKQASLKFAELQEDAEAEGEERHNDLLDTAQSLVNTDVRQSGQHYRTAINSWLVTSLANASLLRTKEMEAGGSADSVTPTGADIINTFETLPEADEPAEQRQYPRSWWVQYQVLFKRTFVGTLRNPAECAMRLLTNVWVAMFAGLVYIRLPDNANSASSRLAALFFLTLIFQMTPFSYMSFYFADRRFFIRDSANGLYAPSAYQLAAVTAGIPFVILNTCASVCTFYGLCGLRYEWQAIFICMSILTLHTLVAQQFAIWSVWFTESQDAAYAITSSYLSLCLLLCGFYIRLADMKLSFYKGLTWATFSKYTFQALSINELQDRVWDLSTCTQSKPVPLGGGAVPACNTAGNTILNYYDFHLTIAICAAALLGFWGLFNIMSYHALLGMYRKRK